MPEQTLETLKSSAGKKAAQAAQSQASFDGGTSQPSFASQQSSDPVLDRILQEQADTGSDSAAQELRERQIADAQQSFQETQQAYQEQKKGVTPDLIKTKDNKQNIIDFFQQFSPLAQGGKLFGAGVELLFGTKPRAEQMSNPNALSIIRLTLLNENGQLDPKKVKEYYERHKDIIDKGTGVGSLEAAEENKGLTNFDAFSNLMENAAEDGIQGTRSQFLADPEAYYDQELYETLEQPLAMENYPKILKDLGLKPLSSRFGNTTTNLVDKANIDVNTPGLSDKFIQEIFDARMQLDAMGKDRSGNPQGGGSTGIPSLYGGPITPSDPNAILKKPGLKNPFGLPDDYSSGFMQSEFYKPNQPGLAVMTPVKLPDGTTHMFPDSSSANQFQQYLDYLAMNKMGPSTGTPQAVGTSTGVPAAFNYASIAPQFTGSPYTNQGVSPAFLENLRRFYG